MYASVGIMFFCVNGKENPLDSSSSSQASFVLFILQTASAFQRSPLFQAVMNFLLNLYAALVV